MSRRANGAAGLGGAAGDTHHATAWRIDRATGALAPHGDAAALRARPIHLSVDRAGEFVLIAYNKPSSVSVHRIARDGSLGEAVAVVQRRIGACPRGDAEMWHRAAADGPRGCGDHGFT